MFSPQGLCSTILHIFLSRYVERAEQDKERYGKEFAEFQQSDVYKKYLKDQERKEEQKQQQDSPPVKKKAKKEKKSNAAAMMEEEMTAAAPSSDAATGLDFPLFTEEFLEFNKARETELRQLRKQARRILAVPEERNLTLLLIAVKVRVVTEFAIGGMSE